MSIAIRLPDELSERLVVAADERGMSPEQLAVEMLDRHRVADHGSVARPSIRQGFGFLGMGHSNRRGLSERVKDDRLPGAVG